MGVGPTRPAGDTRRVLTIMTQPSTVDVSPVASDASFDTRRAIVVGVVAVVLGIGLVILVTRLAGTGTLDVKLGDDRFQDISAANLARQIDEGGPVLFPDAGTGEREHHRAASRPRPERGMVRLQRPRPGQPRECTLAVAGRSERSSPTRASRA